MITSRLEIYGIALVILVIAIGGAYFKGRLDAERSIAQKQLADNSQAMQRYANVEQSREQADDLARQKTLAFMGAVEQGIANVNSKFSSLAMVDSRGCERLTGDARLRWNAVELLPAGPTEQPAGSAPGAVPVGAMPPAR